MAIAYLEKIKLQYCCKRSCRDIVMIHLVRCICFCVTHFNIDIVAKHLPEKDNIVADKLSRNNTDQVFLMCRTIKPIPQMILVIPTLSKLLKETLSLVIRTEKSTSSYDLPLHTPFHFFIVTVCITTTHNHYHYTQPYVRVCT